MKKVFSKRLSRLRRSLSARDLDAVLITCPENRFYLSGFQAEDLSLSESSGSLLITRNENLLLTDGRYKEQAQREAPLFRTLLYKRGMPLLVAKLFRELDIKRCGYEPGFISCQTLKRLKEAVYPRTFTDFGDLLFRMRAQKDRPETERIKEAQKVAEEVFEDAISILRPGVTEKEIAFEILKGLYLKANGPSFPPIVASGPNSALPHAVPGKRRIRQGEPIIIDMGARLDGYCSDMTRTMFIGEPDDFMKEIYSVVRKAQEAAQDFIRPGVRARDADRAARDVIKRYGYEKYFCHGLGHGVGVAIHEAPALSFRNRKHLKAGMVVTVEPGIYIPGRGGVRLENMGIIREDGIEIITSKKWYHDFRP